MNVYLVTVQPKAVSGSGYASTSAPYASSSRTISIVTTTLQEAMSIARSKISDKEEVTGIYLSAEDVVVDYSHIIGTN